MTLISFMPARLYMAHNSHCWHSHGQAPTYKGCMQVWVKVSQVQDDGGPPKVSCSMKQVSQEDGADLDPQNTMGARRGGHPGFQGPASEAPPEVRPPLSPSRKSCQLAWAGQPALGLHTSLPDGSHDVQPFCWMWVPVFPMPAHCCCASSSCHIM